LNSFFYRWLDRIFFGHQTSIIMYHGLTGQNDQLLNYHGKHLHVQTFKKHLQHLKKYYSPISLDQFVHHCLTKEPIPKNAVVLTFDDGYESNFTLGFFALKEFNVPATIFLTTDFVEQKQFIWPNRVEYSILSTKLSSVSLPLNGKEQSFDLSHDKAKKEAVNAIKMYLITVDEHLRSGLVDTLESSLGQKLVFGPTTPLIHKNLNWQQIKEMSDSKLISFGAHTCSHPILALCAPDSMNKEINAPKKIIEKELNKNCPLFCYPYGGKNTFNSQTKEALQKAGYTCALTTITGKNDRSSDLFELKRLGTSDLVGMDHFAKSLLTRH